MMDEYVVRKGPHYLVDWSEYHSVWRNNLYHARRLLQFEAIVLADLHEADVELVTNVS